MKEGLLSAAGGPRLAISKRQLKDREESGATALRGSISSVGAGARCSVAGSAECIAMQTGQ